MFEVNALGYRLRFVDREAEVEVLRGWVERGSPVVEFVYGPEGCGKSTLLRYVAKTLSRGGSVVVYVDALERDPSRAVVGVDLPRGELVEIGRALGGPLGAALASGLSRLVEAIASRLRVSGRNLALLIDDPIKALGLERGDAYVKWLYEFIYKIPGEYGAGRVLALVTASEGLSRRMLSRHTYLHTSLIWNLPRQGFAELLEQLPQPGVGEEEAWLVTGGNPRALIDLALRYGWNVERWVRDLQYRLAEVVRRARLEGFERLLAEALEDPDALWYTGGAEKLAHLLEAENLVLYKHSPALAGAEISEDKSLGIGRYYAWQIPAYRDAIQRLLENN